MKIKIFYYNQKEEYNSLLDRFSLSLDIYFDFDFLICDALLQGGTAEVFVAYDANNILVYPYIRAPFTDEKYKDFSDVIAPYGYAGPVTNSQSDQFLLNAEEELVKYFINTGTVTEFVRYHFKDSFCFNINITNEVNRTIVILPLNEDWDTIWSKQFSGTNRNLIRKLLKEQFTVEECDNLDAIDEFHEMYKATMDNAGANDFYYFDKDFFHQLKNKLGNKLRLFRVVKDGITYSSSFFFYSDKIVTYYLSARNLAYPKVPSTNFLLASVAQIAKNDGYLIFNLGGGITNKADDSLLKFKLNFSNNTAIFHVGKRIHLPDIYENFKQDYIARHGLANLESKKHILQFYRV